MQKENYSIVIQPTFFAPIIQYVHIAKSTSIVFEIEDNFQKQTYRNRCYISSANGKQLLNVPVVHNKGLKLKTKEIKIDNKVKWQQKHLRALKTSYNASPFFEFYIDDLMAVFEKRWDYLIDLNMFCHQTIMEALDLRIASKTSLEYIKNIEKNDFRGLANVKEKKHYNLDPYYQLFEDRNGFLPNLSILDLLFLEGPNALNYLEYQLTE